MLKTLKKKKVWIPLLILTIVITGVIISKATSDTDMNVDAEHIERRNIVHKVNASGKIQPEEEVQITSTITGSQKLISKQELEQIETSFEIALSQAEQARASLQRAKDELSKTRLTAPKYGIVTSLTKEEGEMAVGGMFNPMVLMSIADLSYMEVLVDVNENDVVNIDTGDTTEIEIDAFPDTMFYGVVSEIAHTAQSLNMGSQEQVTNFKVKVRILLPPDKIRPGMSSTVNIITETIADAVSIPILSFYAFSSFLPISHNSRVWMSVTEIGKKEEKA